MVELLDHILRVQRLQRLQRLQRHATTPKPARVAYDQAAELLKPPR